MPKWISVMLLGWVLPAGGVACATAAPAMPVPELKVQQVDGADGGKAYRIDSSGTVAATRAVAWRVLTDYDHLADYVPDLKSARVLARDGDKVTVEQVGAARFFIFSREIRLVVLVHEQAPHTIDVSLIEGDLKAYHCSWELIPLDSGGTRVLYHADIEPGFYVPGLVGASLVRKDIARLMTAVLARMDRDR